IFWCTFNGAWTGGNPSVSRSGSTTQPLTAAIYAFRPSVSNAWAKHVCPNHNTPSTSTTVSITGITNTVGNTVTMAFWASPDDNSWGNLTGTGWNVAGAAQYRNTGGSQQSLTAAYKVMAAAGATGNTSKQQTANGSDATHTSIISWFEAPPPANDECVNAIA